MILSQEDLSRATGYDVKQTKKIIQCLNDQGVHVFDGRPGRIFSFTELFLDAANNKKNPEDVSDSTITIDTE